MSIRQPRYSKEEVARLGGEIYKSRVSKQVEADNVGKYVAIDIETGAFEVADDTMIAARQLRIRVPNAQIWMVRIGHRAVHRFGARSLKGNP